MRRIATGALGALLALAPAAEARQHFPARGHRILPAAGGALDGFQAPQAAYGLRKLLSSYSGFATELRRNSDNALLNVGFTASGDYDTATAAAHCAATTCSVRSWYDQTGNGFTISSGTAANQPLLTFNCIGTKPCLEISTASTQHTLVDGNITPATGIVSLSTVARRVGGANVCVFIKQTPNNRLGATSANNWGGPGSLPVTPATDGAWHAGTSVINGASSVIDMDGTRTSGTATGTTVAGQPGFAGTNTVPCSMTEGIIWDNYVLPQAASAALIANQQNYWFAPLDTFAQPSGAYSFRKLKSTYAGPAIRIRRASDNAELDINFLGCTGFTGCPWDEAAAAAHCAATTCWGRTWYDQSGAVRDLLQATGANQPQLVFGCNGALPCWRWTASTQVLQASGTVTPATGTVSFSVVAMRSGGVGSFSLLSENAAAGNRAVITGTASTWGVFGGTGGSVTTSAATDGVWHAMNAVLAGAATVVNVDGVETTGAATGSVTAALPRITGPAAGTTGNQVEAVFWDNYSLTAGERAVLRLNQQSFWGTP